MVTSATGFVGSAALNLSAITIRNAHERPEGMDVSALIMSELKAERVLQSVKVVTSQHQRDERIIQLVSDCQGGAVSKQVVRIVLSYTDSINRTVWSKK